MNPISLAQALLAVCLCLQSRSAWAEPREPASGFAFDGFDGYGYLGHTDFLGAHQGAVWGAPMESQLEAGGVLRAWLRYSNLEARLGIAGILHRAGSGSTGPHSRVIKFDPGIDEAALHLSFPWTGSNTALEVGRLRFKTNPDAVLFGEYLTRYGAYPGSVDRSTMDWDSLGSLIPRVDALRFSWGGPGMRSDFLLLFDSSMVADNTDFSFALFLEGTLARGLTWGAGGELFRALSTEPEGLTPHTRRNGYVKTDSGYVPLSHLPYDTVPRPREDTGYFTRSATMFSLRAAVDFGDLYGAEGEGAGGWRDWRVFAEAALLGWGNQPLFYEDRWSRLAWTIGVHAPTGGWLDELCVQAERHPSHYIRVFSPYPDDLNVQGRQERESEKWKWGVFASKSVWGALSVQFQYLTRPLIAKMFYFEPTITENRYPANWTYEGSFSLRLQVRF